MEFSINHPILFIMAGILVAVVLGQSVYFLVKALRRAKAIGMDMSRLTKTIRSAAIFTIAPAVAIVISIITLSTTLGATPTRSQKLRMEAGVKPRRRRPQRVGILGSSQPSTYFSSTRARR